jgi:hypothetical protein
MANVKIASHVKADAQVWERQRKEKRFETDWSKLVGRELPANVRVKQVPKAPCLDR